MRQTFAVLLFGLTTFTSAAVHAQQRLDAAGFGLNVEFNRFGESSMNLLSDTGGTTRIGLTRFDATLGLVCELTETEGYDVAAANGGDALFSFDVREGYRITSLSLSGILTGVVSPGMLPGSGGMARNEFSISGQLNQGDQEILLGPEKLINVHGNHALALQADVPLDGDFSLYFSNYFRLDAQGAPYWDPDSEQFVFYPSTASVAWHDAVLTVQVSPVPEPSTWGMLLLGVTLLGVVARFAPARARMSAPG